MTCTLASPRRCASLVEVNDVRGVLGNGFILVQAAAVVVQTIPRWGGGTDPGAARRNEFGADCAGNRCRRRLRRGQDCAGETDEAGKYQSGEAP